MLRRTPMPRGKGIQRKAPKPEAKRLNHGLDGINPLFALTTPAAKRSRAQQEVVDRMVADAIEDDLTAVLLAKPKPLVLRRGVYTPVADTPAPAVPKTPEYRDTPLRMAIASLPCLHCGRPSQCAHANTPPFGKGGSVKAQDWAGFPLCPDGPGYVGCHTRHDQYMAGLTKSERIDCEAMLICRTLGMLIERGLLVVNVKALP